MRKALFFVVLLGIFIGAVTQVACTAPRKNQNPKNPKMLLAVFTCWPDGCTSSTIEGDGVLGWINVNTGGKNRKNHSVIGASVKLFRKGSNQLVDSTTSRKHGEFSFSNLLPGKYFLLVSKDGYKTARFPFKLEEGKLKEVDIELKIKRLK